MQYLFIAGVNKTAYLVRNSVHVTEELNERTNKARFSLTYQPAQYQEVKIFEGFTINSAGADYVVLDATEAKNANSLFRTGNKVYVGVATANEETAVISAITTLGGLLKLTMTANFASIPSADQICGKLKFAGNIVYVHDRNITTLANIIFDVDCLDFTRIFDKKLINESYVNRTSRYIVNDFCNTTINKNQELDSMYYADDAAIRAEWVETGDGNNPSVDNSDFQESNGAGLFDWTFAGGTATFSATPVSCDISDYTGVASGTPSKGVFGFWYKCTDYTKVTNIKARVGSDSSNYAEITITPTSNSWAYADSFLKDASITGVPDWTAVDYLAIIITETADSSVRFCGFRVLETGFYKHYPHVQESGVFDEYNIAYIKPSEVMQTIAGSLGWYWLIDYEKNIKLFPSSSDPAPFEITETSDNFDNLSIDYDSSRLTNRQVVEGGDETSTSTYSEVKEGDGIIREWLTKSKFNNLIVSIDKNTSTDTCEAGTTTTNITATGHGLVSGDYIVNRTRSNAVREITYVDPDNFTVDTVTGQTNGDTFSKFTAQTVGYEGIDADAGNNFMANYNQKSIRNASAEATLIAGEFILFQYNEVIPIIVIRKNSVSISDVISTLGYSDGIFDGQPLRDKTIKSRSEAMQAANIILNKYSKLVITARFSTYIEGLRTGQEIHIKDTSNGTRNINLYFTIIASECRQVEQDDNIYNITCITYD